MRALATCVAAVVLCTACDQVRQFTEPREYNGAYIVIEIDTPAVVSEHLEGMSEQSAAALRSANVRYLGRGVSEGVLRIRVADTRDLPRARSVLAPITGHLTITEQPEGVIEARVGDAYLQSVVNQAAEQSIDIIKRRVAPIRSGYLVESFGPGRLIVRTNEAAMPELVLRAVSLRGQITFHMCAR